MKKIILILALCAACALSLWALTVQGSLNILGTLTASVVDMSAATSTRPVKEAASDPATCTEGMRYYNTTLHKGRLCTGTNTWADEAGSGGGASFSAVDPDVIWMREDFVSGKTDVASTTTGTSQMRTVPISSGSTDVVAASADLVGHPGIMRFVSGSTTGNGVWGGFSFVGSATSQSIINWSDLYNKDWEYVTVIKMGSTANVRLRAGITNSTTIAGSGNSASMWIRYDTNASYGDGSKAAGAGAFVAQICGYDDANCASDTSGLTATLAGTVDTNWVKLRIYHANSKINFQVGNNTAKTACLSGGGCDMTLPSNPGYGLTTYSGTASLTWGTDTTEAKTTLVDLVAFQMSGLAR